MNAKIPKIPLLGNLYYGWVIVFMGALGLFFSGPGQTFAISVFVDVYLEHFGWSSTLISSMYLAATLLSGSLLFVLGRLVDRYGQRRMTAVVGILLAVACLFNSFIMGPVMLFIGFFMLRLFGQGAMTLLPNTLVPQWFIVKRGRAMAFMAIGIFASSALTPPLNAWFIDMWGWPVAWRIWFALLLFVFVPLAIVLIRNKPEDVGLLPDNAIKFQPKHEKNVSQVLPEQNWTVKEAIRTRAFWFLLYGVAVPALVSTGLVFHLVSILGEVGVSRAGSALILSIMAVVSFIFSLIAGVIVERVKVHIVFASVMLGYIIILILMILTNSFMMAVIFGVVKGIVMGFQVICIGVIWPNYFGRKHLGSIKGLVMTSTVIGSGLGPLPLAMAFDAMGNMSICCL